MPTLRFLLVFIVGGAFLFERSTVVAEGQPRVQPPIRLGVDTFSMRFDGRDGIKVQSVLPNGSGYRFRRAWAIVAPNGQVASEEIDVSLDSALNVTFTRHALRFGVQERRTEVAYSNGRADGIHTTSSGAAASTVPIAGVVPSNSVDASALYTRILARAWSVGQSDTLRLWDPTSQRVSMQTVTAMGRSIVSVGAVQISALKLEMRTTGLLVVTWISESRPHRWLRDSSASSGSQIRSP